MLISHHLIVKTYDFWFLQSNDVTKGNKFIGKCQC